MEFRKECVRAILLYIKNNMAYGDRASVSRLAKMVYHEHEDSDFEKNEIKFHIDLLVHEKYLKAQNGTKHTDTLIDGMTEKGFKLCESLKPPAVWEKLKDVDFLTLGDLALRAATLFVALQR